MDSKLYIFNLLWRWYNFYFISWSFMCIVGSCRWVISDQSKKNNRKFVDHHLRFPIGTIFFRFYRWPFLAHSNQVLIGSMWQYSDHMDRECRIFILIIIWQQWHHLPLVQLVHLCGMLLNHSQQIHIQNSL